MKVDAVAFSKTPVFARPTQHHIPEDSTVHSQHYENLKSIPHNPVLDISVSHNASSITSFLGFYLSSDIVMLLSIESQWTTFRKAMETYLYYFLICEP
jgi:hypothetical protein